jgi:hypothetical protein
MLVRPKTLLVNYFNNATLSAYYRYKLATEAIITFLT